MLCNLGSGFSYSQKNMLASDATAAASTAAHRPEEEGKAKSVNAVTFALLTFFMVTGGPNGIEPVVEGSGGFWALLGFVVFPLFYSMPQSLMTAELSSMMPEDGGYVIWVSRGLGPFWGWINSYNSMICNLIDNSVYPALFGTYLRHEWPELDGIVLVLVEVAMVCFVLTLNVLGIEMVAKTSMVLLVVVLIPYLLLFILRIPYIDPSTQWVPYAVADCNWGLYFATIIWIHTGWDGMGTIASEVANPKRTYAVGFSLANALIMIVNLLPIIAGLTLTADRHDWEDGVLTEFADEVAPWLGYITVLSCAISNIGLFMANLVESSRAMWAMGSNSIFLQQLPSVFHYTWAKYDTPVVALGFQCLVTLVLMNFDFEKLVIMDSIMNGVSLILEFVAFLTLKYTEPDAPRPFCVPGGLAGAWAITIPKALIISAIFFFYEWYYLVIGVGLNVLFAVLYYFTHVYKHNHNDNDNSSNDDNSTSTSGRNAAYTAIPATTTTTTTTADEYRASLLEVDTN